MAEPAGPTASDAIPFEAFTRFRRIEQGNPIIACEPPEWAAAAHAIVVDDTVHYLWARRRADNYWTLMHSTAPASAPSAVEHDPRNPVLLPSEEGFDDWAVEYPFPFRNPADGRFYVYYLGARQGPPKQTGLLVGDGDFGEWTRVRGAPVIPADTGYDRHGSSHPSVAIEGETIHIIYTGRSQREWSRLDSLTLCHATAPTGDPANVTKDAGNPVFTGTGEEWDSGGVRETELLKGPHYFHIFYGGHDGKTWRIGHVRTRDFRTFEANPHNPIFAPSPHPGAWDCDGVLTPQVIRIGGVYHMVYAGKRGGEWQTGLAMA
ncbi:MAG: hypothetical protein AMK73_00920 [Planctomycetes bacterium SM23_32]|nr:MAG: hypothetical protein AMK73_00920 [Planctomycetes bacterium SM23_32]